jgi:hypothetical protein
MKTLKNWQITELKRLLQLKCDSIRNDRYRLTTTIDFSFPSFEIMNPLQVWKAAAQNVNQELGNVERAIRDLILCSSKKDWAKIRSNNETR